MTTTRIASLVALTALTACGTPDLEPVDTDRFQARRIATVDAERVLAFLNRSDTTQVVLDQDVGLDERAAECIISHRNGPDALYGTSDDNPYDSLEELDHVKWVGSATLDRLLAYVDGLEDLETQIIEGVTLNSTEVELILWGLNQADVEELHDQVGLDVRAATNLVDYGPYEHIAQVAEVPWVGTVTIRALRDYTSSWYIVREMSALTTFAGVWDDVEFTEELGARSLELANVATYDKLVEGGVWSAGAMAIVEGRPYATMGELADTYGVGTATLEQLRALAEETLELK